MTVRAVVHVSADQLTVCDTEQGFKVPKSDVQVEFCLRCFRAKPACTLMHTLLSGSTRPQLHACIVQA